MAVTCLIDCDPGTDDALALLLAFGSPELDIAAITVVAGNVGLDRTLANARALVALAAARVPVFAGADRPFLGRYKTAAHAHGEDGLGGVRLSDGAPAAPGIAADAIRRILREVAEPVTIVGIGPATNLAIALHTEPALAPRIACFVLMSGAWGEGNVTPAAEFNAHCDPEALAAVLALGRPVVLATLEVTAQALATQARLAALAAAGPGRALAAACAIQGSVPFTRDRVGAALHDPCAVAWLLRPDLFTARPARVSVDLGPASRGRTNIERGCRVEEANAMVLETLDADGFFALLAERLGRLP
ncbi:MAG TPA: nucleoside hydrolase [Acetobacteraceae bacterium]